MFRKFKRVYKCICKTSLNDKALKHKGIANLKNSLQNKTKNKKIL